MAMFGPQPRARGTPARPRPPKAIAAGTLLAAGLMLASCAPGALSFQSQRIAYEPADDACRGRVLALDSTGNFFAARILAGAAIGAGGGALIGGVASQSWNGALIGAISGAVVGGAAGYWSGLEQQNLSNAALADRMSGDLSRENAEIDRTQVHLRSPDRLPVPPGRRGARRVSRRPARPRPGGGADGGTAPACPG